MVRQEQPKTTNEANVANALNLKQIIANEAVNVSVNINGNATAYANVIVPVNVF